MLVDDRAVGAIDSILTKSLGYRGHGPDHHRHDDDRVCRPAD
jgi:hypothetical protein